jgi:hypothetical protein
VTVGNGCRPTALAVDAAHAYCAGSDQTVRAISLADGTATALAALPAFDLTVDGARVYFTTTYGERVAGGNANSVVGAVPTDGGAVVPLATTQLLPSSVAVDAAFVYWLDVAEDSDGTHAATGIVVMRAPLDGGAATLLGTASGVSPGRSGNKAIAVDAMGVYFTNEAALLRLPLSGGAPTTLATGISGALAIDDTTIYWAAAGSSGAAIMKSALTGGPASTLVAGENVASIAVDSARVYWSNPAKGTIAWVAK